MAWTRDELNWYEDIASRLGRGEAEKAVTTAIEGDPERKLTMSQILESIDPLTPAQRQQRTFDQQRETATQEAEAAQKQYEQFQAAGTQPPARQTLAQEAITLGLGQLGGVPESTESQLLQARQQELAQRQAEVLGEQAAAEAQAARDINVQAAQDVALAQQAASARARQELGGAAGAGAAAAAGAQAAYQAGEQMAPQALQEARARQERFIGRGYERGGLAAEVGADVNVAAQQRAAMDKRYRDMLQRQREVREAQRQASEAQMRRDQEARARQGEDLRKTADAAQQRAKSMAVTPPEQTPSRSDQVPEVVPQGLAGMTTGTQQAPTPQNQVPTRNLEQEARIAREEPPAAQAQGPQTPTGGQQMMGDDQLAEAIQNAKATESMIDQWAQSTGVANPEMVRRLKLWLNWIDNPANQGPQNKYRDIGGKDKLLAQTRQGTLEVPSDEKLKVVQPRSNELSDEDMKVIDTVPLQRRWF